MGGPSDYKKNAGFIGGLSLLVSSVTGPGIITIPLVFQQAGWVFPSICFVIIAFLSALGCLFLIESMTYFPGNDKFQLNVELTVLVHQFYGRKWYYIMHIVLFGSLQSYNIASIISSAQTFDAFLITLFGKTCGFGVSPVSGFVCVSEQSNSNSPFGDNYMLITMGFLLLLVLVVPLIMLDLNDNLIVQLLSTVYLGLIIFVWVIMAFVVGIGESGMRPVEKNLTATIGQVMFNYTLANTVPSWVNTKHKSVKISKTIWYSTWIATGMYLFLGIFAGAAFPMPSDSNLIQAIASNDKVSAAGKAVNSAINVTYPILVLLTSIPVSIIIVKLNLVTSRLCTGPWATFWAAIFPFLAALPFQTGAWITYFSNWSSLIFQSLCNFAAPFLVYLYLPRRNLIMQQSVLDELEFLDIDGGVKKWSNDDDDDFDYVYHLPHADLSKLGMRRYNPFAPMQASAASLMPQGIGGGGSVATNMGIGFSTGPNGVPVPGGASVHQSQFFSAGPKFGQSTAGISTASGRSAKQLMRQMLGPGGGGGAHRRLNRQGRLASGAASNAGSASMMNLGGPGDQGGLGVPGGLTPGGSGSRRLSVMLTPGNNKIHPTDDLDDVEAKAGGLTHDELNKPPPLIVDETGELGQYKALPPWVTRRIHPRYIAAAALAITMTAAVAVLILEFRNVAETGLVLGDGNSTDHEPHLEVVGDV